MSTVLEDFTSHVHEAARASEGAPVSQHAKCMKCLLWFIGLSEYKQKAVMERYTLCKTTEAMVCEWLPVSGLMGRQWQ